MIPASPEEWGQEFARILRGRYGLEPSDTYHESIEEWREAFYGGETPEQVVEELATAKDIYKHELIVDKSLDLGDTENEETAFIPNRNAFFALIASLYGQNIIMAGLKDDHCIDKTPTAFLAMQNLLNEINAGQFFTVTSPFWNLSKIEVIEMYLASGGPVSALLKTSSCYHPIAAFCGECPACYRRFCAFKYLKLPVPDFTNHELAQRYYDNREAYRSDPKRYDSIVWASEWIGVLK